MTSLQFFLPLMASREIFHRFQWVIPGQLARFSAPHYHGRDSIQNMDQAAVDELTRLGINTIVSMNSVPLSANQQALVATANIKYNHILVGGLQPPTLAQLTSIRYCVAA